MKLFLISIFTMLLSGGYAGAKTYVRKDVGPWGESFSSFSFETSNLVPLYLKARERYPFLDEHELASRVKMNIKYIFHNRLNRERFLVAPSPELIIGQIHSILELNDELRRLTDNGRAMLMKETEPEQFGALALEMGRTAGELKDSFEGFFLEGGKSEYVLQYPKTEPISAQFVHFILQSEKINRMLSQRLGDFFFGASPGAIALDDYGRSSILVLSESLCKLSQLVERDISRSSRIR
jgi:hypothetical protein